jgi:hypothetical protein
MRRQLDAHPTTDPDKWPLPQEIAAILGAWSEGYIVIDDLLVPERPEYGGADLNVQVRLQRGLY